MNKHRKFPLRSDLDPLIVALRERREAMGRTQSDVAEAMNFASRATISDWESGAYTPSSVKLARWGAALGLTLGWSESET